LRIERWVAPSGRERLLVRLEPTAAARYARAARLAIPRPPSAPRSYGSARRPELRPRFAAERRAWRGALLEVANPDAVAVLGDVATCFPSIGERALRAAARASGGEAAPLIAVLRQIWDRGPGGLPIGPAASSYLADAVLSLADVAAARAGVMPVRWVDDVAFIGDREAVRRSARAWAAALSEFDLREHEAKRRRAEPMDLVRGAGYRTSLADLATRGIIRA
jgi:hypothetical protein